MILPPILRFTVFLTSCGFLSKVSGRHLKILVLFLLPQSLILLNHVDPVHYTKTRPDHISYMGAVGLASSSEPNKGTYLSFNRYHPKLFSFSCLSVGVLWVKALGRNLTNLSEERKIWGRLCVAPWTQQSLEKQGSTGWERGSTR